MSTSDLQYSLPEDVAVVPRCSAAVCADNPSIARMIADDARGIGFMVGHVGIFDAMTKEIAEYSADVVIIDIDRMTPDRCRELREMDRKIAGDGQHLVMSLPLDLLDQAYRCISPENSQILATTSRVERLMALISARGRKRSDAVRELEERERKELRRLNQEVNAVANRIAALLGEDKMAVVPESTGETVFRLESPADSYLFDTSDPAPVPQSKRSPRPPLPDAHLVRKLIAARKARGEYFDENLFADPAWDMLLDLTAARVEHKRVSVTSLCIASGVPPTTALRWIGQMVNAGLLKRVNDDMDRRRAFITLTDKAADAMARYFAELDGKGVI